ncbi:hypothetical protein [Roseomonas sp. KE0001]|uniref:cell division protein FtsL n=1 Tax=unclassified Roseomonas TaxID=2617492 RepID=UPI0018E02EA5|nr:hypothetical protein [Roseomonas sp. KE0001]MBI0433957.1 hypothetical protein [Roseomonas sp. KE0001]
MFRPLTVVAILAFSAVGWHVYRAEEAAAQLDRELRDVSRRIEAARERSQVLRAEWALLNQPERLRQVAQKHLALDTMTPSQFVRMTELERRLPVAVAFAGPVSLFGPAPETALAEAALPVPPEPPAEAPALAEAPRPAPITVAAAAARMPEARPARAESRPQDSRAAEPAPRPAPRAVETVREAPHAASQLAAARAAPAPRRPVPAVDSAREAPAAVVAAPAVRAVPRGPLVADTRPAPRPDLLRTAAHVSAARAVAAPGNAAPGGSSLGMVGGSSLAPPVPMAAPVPVRPGTWQ